MKKLILCGVLLLLSLHCNSKDSILWLTDDQDDLNHYRVSEPYSIGMDTTNLVLAALDEYDISFVFSSVARMDAQLRATANTCVANRIKTPEREATHLFSLPLNVHPLAQLYYNATRIHIPPSLRNQDGQVTDLKALLDANPGTRIALVKGVSLGATLDRQVKALSEEQISYYSVDNRFQSGPKLLLDGLVDASLDYPTQIALFFPQRAQRTDIKTAAIAQEKQFVISHISCSRSPLGQRVIDSVDQALRKLYRSAAFLEAHLRHVPQENKVALRAFYDETISPYITPTLTMAVDHFPPYTVLNDNQPPSGLDVQIMRAIATPLHAQLNFVQCPFARCVKMLENGSADVYVSLFRSPQREKRIHFVEPAIAKEPPQAFYVRADSPLRIDSYDALSNLTIGVLRDSEYFAEFDQDKRLRKVPLSTLEGLIDMLLKGRIDTFIGSQTVTDYLLASTGHSEEIRHASYVHPGSRDVYIGLSKASANAYLRREIGEIVEQLKAQGTINAILGQSPGKPASSAP
ncbi:transporter substrate-binding domain-containing protein [Aestuariibacter halophilus]|uniref:Transporter substrate-binding domain-containing protein n=1 Tax=Fluctibacter halophilus TaxID=226011 RepID=A0ABS8G8G7_9ALTE|nr:transporter substrate-binding domain-containing protein [Aestuariibacter halophilus]MCC2616840.1 transporter substrate-binding domain-containing protein [Aestuariibacter halophilus]